jgi:hypothetical protein
VSGPLGEISVQDWQQPLSGLVGHQALELLECIQAGVVAGSLQRGLDPVQQAVPGDGGDGAAITELMSPRGVAVGRR